MMARAQVNGEWTLLVGEQVPSGTAQGIAFDSRDTNSLPAQFSGVPCFTLCSPGKDGVEASEDDEIVLRESVDVDNRLKRDVRGVLWM